MLSDSFLSVADRLAELWGSRLEAEMGSSRTGAIQAVFCSQQPAEWEREESAMSEKWNPRRTSQRPTVYGRVAGATYSTRRNLQRSLGSYFRNRTAAQRRSIYSRRSGETKRDFVASAMRKTKWRRRVRNGDDGGGGGGGRRRARFPERWGSWIGRGGLLRPQQPKLSGVTTKENTPRRRRRTLAPSFKMASWRHRPIIPAEIVSFSPSADAPPRPAHSDYQYYWQSWRNRRNVAVYSAALQTRRNFHSVFSDWWIWVIFPTLTSTR